MRSERIKQTAGFASRAYVDSHSGSGVGGAIYAPTGGPYITFVANDTLSAEKILTASNNITITTDANTIWISANTGTGTSTSNVVYAATGNSYVTLSAPIAGDLSDYFVITASNNAQITTGTNIVYITALTPTVVAQSGGTIYTSTGTYFVLSQSDPLLTNYKLITASNNITVSTGATQVFIQADTAPWSAFSSSSAYFITSQTDPTLTNYKVLTASNNIVLRTDASAVYVEATTGKDSVLYSTTGGYFVTSQTDPTLPNEKVLTASNNATVTTGATAIYISATTAPWSAFSSSSAYFITSQSDPNLTNYKVLTASNNIIISTDNGIFYIEAQTGAGASGVVYAPTGGNYVSWDADAGLTSEKILTAGTNVSITTDATTIWVNADTALLLDQEVSKQKIVGGLDFTSTGSIAIRLYADSGNYDETHQPSIYFYSDGTATVGSIGYFNSINDLSFRGSGKQSLRFFSNNTMLMIVHSDLRVGIGQGLTNPQAVLHVSGGFLANNFGGYTDTSNEYVLAIANTQHANSKVLTAGTNVTVTTDSTTIWINEANPEKGVAFFAAGNLATTMPSEKARIYIPFNVNMVKINATVLTSAIGADIKVMVNQYGTPDGSALGMSSVTIGTALYAGSAVGTFSNTTIYSGSYLGIDITQVGSTIAGSDLTVTVITRPA